MSVSQSGAVADLFHRLRSELCSLDMYTLCMCVLYSAMALVLYPYVPKASSILFENVLIAAVIGGSILLKGLTGLRLFAMIRYFYIVPVIYMMYDQTHAFVRIVHPVDYDDVLITVDRLIFGLDPTVWLQKWSFPVVTEYLQICYFLFYVLPIMQAVELWRRGDLPKLVEFARAMAFCYFVSYLLYFAMPAIGPRFTLHDYSALSLDLPGLAVTDLLRHLVNVGGGIPWNATDPISVVNRDCMPSGHTMLTLTNLVLGFKNRSRYRWFFVVIGGSLIISTVYLRYHYVVDVLVGALLVAIVLPIEPRANRCVDNLKNIFSKV